MTDAKSDMEVMKQYYTKGIIIGAAISSLVWILFQVYFYKLGTSSDNNYELNNLSAKIENINTLVEANTGVKQELTKILLSFEGRISELENQLDTTKDEKLETLTSVLGDKNPSPIDSNIIARQPEDIESSKTNDSDEKVEFDTQETFAQKVMSDPNFNPIDNIHQQLEQQVKDYNWAIAYENHLTDLFFKDEHLQQFQVENVNCKETLCELKVFSSDPPHVIGTILAKALADQSWRDESASFIFNDESNNGTVTFYIGKDEDSLRF